MEWEEMYLVNKTLILLCFSFLFTQEPCDGTCLSIEETQNIANNIKELEFDLNKQLEINENLNSQIYMYIQSDSLYKSQIEDYKKQLEMSEEMIKLVKPKWHENKYLWFFGGILITSGSVYLAGQIK
tara:strand:- start:1606 stop:1986 length:381 start_codon:yes stop_codon:yes gene_type:complete